MRNSILEEFIGHLNEAGVLVELPRVDLSLNRETLSVELLFRHLDTGVEDPGSETAAAFYRCLLYTSDAADEL